MHVDCTTVGTPLGVTDAVAAVTLIALAVTGVGAAAETVLASVEP
jgi:hypothetical protein